MEVEYSDWKSDTKRENYNYLTSQVEITHAGRGLVQIHLFLAFRTLNRKVRISR